jgi:hypothetical protein
MDSVVPQNSKSVARGRNLARNPATYKTILKWTHNKNQIIPFYKVNGGIGYIPAGIDFIHRNKRYTTMMLVDLILKSAFVPKTTLPFTCDMWYDMSDGTHLTPKWPHLTPRE